MAGVCMLTSYKRFKNKIGMKLYYKIIDDKKVYSNCKTIELNQIINGVKVLSIIINPTEEQIEEAGWVEYTAPELSEEEKISKAKDDKISEILKYDSSSSVEEFTINGINMWLDHNLRQQIKTSVDAYTTAGEEYMTKIFNNQEFTFPCSKWHQMLTELEIYASEALNVTQRHILNVKNMSSLEEIENYDYTQNYPDKIIFNA